MKAKGFTVLVIIVAMCALMVQVAAQPTPFMISGYVYYENGDACDNPTMNINNTNTSNNWGTEIKTNANFSYYQLILATGSDINASEILRFNVTSPDGDQSKIVERTVTQEEVNDGGRFNFNISLEGIPMPSVFDTGTGAYPSIFGTHNGTITPEQNITVNRMYTYPCAGTGGHTEYVRIWNESEGLEGVGHWIGYQGDYHNVTISPTITLLKSHEYNYTVRTGSYPRIIHARSKLVTGGNITCAKFTDANGKEYDNWIPAIRLWKEE